MTIRKDDLVIHKQELIIVDRQTVNLKMTDIVLKVGEQNGKLFVWYITNTKQDEPLIPREFTLKGTGHSLDDLRLDDKYIDTVIMSNGFVWHIFSQRKDGNYATG